MCWRTAMGTRHHSTTNLRPVSPSTAGILSRALLPSGTVQPPVHLTVCLKMALQLEEVLRQHFGAREQRPGEQDAALR